MAATQTKKSSSSSASSKSESKPKVKQPTTGSAKRDPIKPGIESKKDPFKAVKDFREKINDEVEKHATNTPESALILRAVRKQIDALLPDAVRAAENREAEERAKELRRKEITR